MQSYQVAEGAPNVIYIAFIIIQIMPVVVSLTIIVKPSCVTRADGTHIAVFKQPGLKGLRKVFTD